MDTGHEEKIKEGAAVKLPHSVVAAHKSDTVGVLGDSGDYPRSAVELVA
jgi:hypothetical protein